jgi:hypothetical protein
MGTTFDYSELKGRIITRFGNFANFAEAINLSRSQLSDRLNNKVKFRHEDILASCSADVLDISAEQIGRYFFTPKV